MIEDNHKEQVLLETSITRTDDKIRKRFVIYRRVCGTHSETLKVIAEGQIYEQRNVALDRREGEGVSEQYSSFDAMLQTFSLNDIHRIECP